MQHETAGGLSSVADARKPETRQKAVGTSGLRANWHMKVERMGLIPEEMWMGLIPEEMWILFSVVNQFPGRSYCR
jgi:hypothetical protein